MFFNDCKKKSKQKQNQANKLVAVIDWTAEVVSRERSWLIKFTEKQTALLTVIYSFVVSVFILHFWEEQIKNKKINRVNCPFSRCKRPLLRNPELQSGLSLEACVDREL